MSMRSSIFFSLHPFANIWSAILKRHAIRFATGEKAHYVAVDDGNVLQIQNNVAAVLLEFKQSPQLGYRRCFDSAAQCEYREWPSRGTLNPESHRLSHIAGAASVYCTAPHSIPEPIASNATEHPIAFH
jgi:hypothetical protein